MHFLRRLQNIILMCHIAELAAFCEFPAFLRTPASSSRPYWLSRTEFEHESNDWKNQLEIFVSRAEIHAKIRFKSEDCFGFEDQPCGFSKVNSYSQMCHRSIGGNKFVVIHKQGARSSYQCVWFRDVSRNVVQVHSSAARETEDANMCSNENLFRDVWPWHAPKIQEWSPCPVQGGFDFRAHQDKKEKCKKSWRPSRMESECVQGEGIVATFPEEKCSFFTDKPLEKRLQCWGHWEEDDYLFVVLSEPGKLPHFVMRFPYGHRTYVELDREFSAHFYFAVITPTSRQGIPDSSTYIKHVILKMQQGSTGICYDESEKCRRYSKKGKCTNNAFHEIANYCKLSCGLCKILPTNRPECRFPPEYQGVWNMFSNKRKEEVSIVGGRINFSDQGEFICKRKHWALNQYTLYSYYQNGCRPRHTCLHMVQDSDHVLRYQISPSVRKDGGFKDLCRFKDDIPPLRDRFRSKELKTILPQSRTTWHSCGLHGKIAINATLSTGGRCTGTLSDWLPGNCSSGNKLQLRLASCKYGFKFSRDYHCLAYVRLQEGSSLLITRSTGSQKDFRCWVVRTSADRMSYRPWQAAFQLQQAQCGAQDDLDPGTLGSANISLYIKSGLPSRPCRTAAPARPALRPTPSQKPGHRPQKDVPYRVDSPFGEYRAAASATAIAASSVVVAMITVEWTSVKWLT